MLGVRLPEDVERKLDRYARAVGRTKSMIVRDWIVERLDRDSIDEQMRRAAAVIAAHETDVDRIARDSDTDAWLATLDEEDGGYDWGPKGPPL
ncbi:hypothetical protein [Sphingomonas sp. DT-204]|uniref:hypothetical protein n=1 Tax=Sphingomonas sp. DT-204 TaxID=3396166 RepID=UPI003F195015